MRRNHAKQTKYGNAKVFVYESTDAMAEAAADATARLLESKILQNGRARIIIGTGNSQAAFIDKLLSSEMVSWSRVEAFHMDEYIDISPDHPASFQHWLRKRVNERKKLAACHYLSSSSARLDVEMARYAELLNSAPIDVAFVGFGENGHIAFNDPSSANFKDPAIIKIVELEPECRQQQVGEGHFKDLASVPTRAVTLTCSALLRAEHWICCVPEMRKARAVKNALEGPISTSCPASIVRNHPSAAVYLDDASATLLLPVASLQAQGFANGI